MVEQALIKRRRRKRIAAIVGGSSATVLIALGIIAFLGQYVGTFTVALRNNEKIQMSCYDNAELQSPTTFLRIGNVPTFTVYTANYISDHNNIDNATNSYLYGADRDVYGNIKYLNYLKYTFFIKNVGINDIDYTFNINVTESTAPDTIDYTLVDIARVRLYEHDMSDDSHTYTTYAKESLRPRVDEKGEKTFKKPIAGELGTPAFCGFAEPFVSDKTLVSLPRTNFKPGEARRYTIVIWLEGEDEKVTGPQPSNMMIKIGTEFISNASIKK